MKYVKITWYILTGFSYLAIVVGILSVASTRFEIVVLAGLVELYAAVLYNASALAVASDANNYAAFIRFRTLATAVGVREDDDGVLFVATEEALGDQINSYKTKVLIKNIANALVSIYAVLRILMAIIA